MGANMQGRAASYLCYLITASGDPAFKFREQGLCPRASGGNGDFGSAYFFTSLGYPRAASVLH
jgi:hypothetical protein